MAAFRAEEGVDARCEEMNSFSEVRAREVMVDGCRAAFQLRHSTVLSRVYPKVFFLLSKQSIIACLTSCFQMETTPKKRKRI